MTEEDWHHFCSEEINRADCFLCRPAARLLVDCSSDHYTVAGLGPLADGYVLVATKDHIDRLGTESSAVVNGFADYVRSIRTALATEFGGCLLTEHGNMPVCGVDSEHSVHCFHPHVLLFPGQHHIRGDADRYFGDKAKVFSSLTAAFEHGAQMEQYLLVSETEEQFTVYEPFDGLPRQFARALVAEALGVQERASWRDFPNVASAVENSKHVRRILDRAAATR